MNKVQDLQNAIENIVNEISGRMGVYVQLRNEHINVNGDLSMPSASLIKIPILLELFHQVEQGLIHLREINKIKDFKRVGGAGVLQSLTNDVKLTWYDLAVLMITVSDNMATNALIHRLNMNAVNDYCHAFTEATVLQREMMDFEAVKEGKDNWTSARDMVKLLTLVDDEHFLSRESRQEIYSILTKQQFQDKLPARMDDTATIANKTGELEGVEHDVAIIDGYGQRMYVAVLTDQLVNSYEGRSAISAIGYELHQYLKKA
ncbi:serine hydrolase [Priestia koreensis]|uniref:serine hydrolase n=1 Tax=Priestia koreensis TaxID=284581 RepID=UPI00301870BA